MARRKKMQCKYGKLKHRVGKRICRLKRPGKRRARITKDMWAQAPAPRSAYGRKSRR
jgi:hypothetical protein